MATRKQNPDFEPRVPELLLLEAFEQAADVRTANELVQAIKD